MASRQRIHLPRFDPAAEFVILRSFKVNGVVHTPGPPEEPRPFDKAQVNERRLRQLFEWRRIGLAGAPAARRSALSKFNASMVGAQASLDQINEKRARAEKEKAEQEAKTQGSFERYRDSLRPKQPDHVNGTSEEPAREPEVAVKEPEPEETTPSYDEKDFLNFDEESKAAHPATRGRPAHRKRSGKKK